MSACSSGSTASAGCPPGAAASPSQPQSQPQAPGGPGAKAAVMGDAMTALYVFCFVALPSGIATIALLRNSPPTGCASVPECAAAIAEAVDASWPQSIASAVIVTLLAQELGNFCCAYRERREPYAVVSLLQGRCVSCGMLCIILTSMLAMQLCFVAGYTWAHAAPVTDDGSWRPVFTGRYLEWIVSVPLLQIIAGQAGLERPFAEVINPIVVTFVYIVFAWLALIVQSSFTRWVLVGLTFAGYGWASTGMLRWALVFRRSAPEGYPNKGLRIFLLVSQVVVFGLYGLVFLLGIPLGVLDIFQEEACYTFLSVTTKAATSICLSSFHVTSDCMALRGAIDDAGSSHIALSTLLQGNFDIVLPCVVSTTGECEILDSDSRDLQKLEQCTGRTVAGASLNRLIVKRADQELFTKYVRHVLEHAGLPAEGLCADFGNWFDHRLQHMPVHVVHCELVRPSSAPDVRTRNKGEAPQQVVIHLSHVSPLGILSQSQDAKNMVVAIRFALALEDTTLRRHSFVANTLLPSTTKPSCANQSHLDVGVLQTSAVAAEGPAIQLEAVDKPSRVKTDESSDGADAAECSRMVSASQSSLVPQDLTASFEMHVSTSEGRLCTQYVAQQLAAQLQRSKEQAGGASSHIDDFEESEVCAPLGGSDVGSQASKDSYIGSVAAVCRQLVGSLCEQAPPMSLVDPTRVEARVKCAAEMVRLKVPIEIARLHRDQSKLLRRSSSQVADQEEDREVTTTHGSTISSREGLRPSSDPPSVPSIPELPGDEELWRRAELATNPLACYNEENLLNFPIVANQGLPAPSAKLLRRRFRQHPDVFSDRNS